MSTAATLAEPSAPDLSEDRAQARDQRTAEREAMLRRLAEIGMAMAEALADELEEVRAAAPDAEGNRPSVAPLSLAYNRVARAVRQTLAMETQVTDGENRRLAGVAAVKAKAAAEIAERESRAETGRLIKAMVAHDILGELIEAEHEDDDETWARLHARANEQLVDAKDDEDFADRSMGELVAAVARAIGLCPDWDRWAGEDWAEEDAEDRPWGSPYGRGFKPWTREDVAGGVGETGPP